MLLTLTAVPAVRACLLLENNAPVPSQLLTLKTYQRTFGGNAGRCLLGR